jgi:hypothetical protein
LGSQNLEQKEFSILHGMLAHSAATAKRHCLKGNDQALPHKAGIPLIASLLDKFSGGQRVSDVFSMSPELNKALTVDNIDTLENYKRKVFANECINNDTKECDYVASTQQVPVLGPSIEKVPVPSTSTVAYSDSASDCGSNSGSSSCSGAPSLAMTDNAKMKAIVELLKITVDSDLPRAADFRKAMQLNPALTIITDNKQKKSMGRYAIEKRNRGQQK